ERLHGFQCADSRGVRQSMIFFVARLKPKTVENRVLKLLIKMMQDSEASIRTNALICVGRVSSHLPAASVSPTLMTVVGMGLKDPFTPCRCAALQTLSATSSCLSPEELAQKLLPGVCHRLIDPDQAVADMAFSTLSKLQDVVRQKMAERREAAQEPPHPPSPRKTTLDGPPVQGVSSAWTRCDKS
ncbi:Probable inactive serine/threonine-protein kinase scy1 (N-terminal kinase-like protein) (SCY1-like protein kinase 1), partial [Durusdinium trenchii]